MLIKLYSDAATRFTDQKSAAGILIVTEHEQIQLHSPLPDQINNHQAEFLAAIEGFQKIDQFSTSDDTVMFYTDSRIVSDSLGKGFSKQYPDLLQQLLQLQNEHHLVINQWVPEKDNLGAHNLALQALR
ncbi:MAG: reverse transcriptase-like protein [Lactobacillaceae bacterium]|nr:reverse transcriptase-like protein [Lactobacillaceae bacterium]